MGLGEDATHGSTSDLQPSRDLRFRHTSAVKVPNLGSMKPGSYGPAESFAILPRLDQTGTSAYSDNVNRAFRRCE
jgi:hypothetical protein